MKDRIFVATVIMLLSFAATRAMLSYADMEYSLGYFRGVCEGIRAADGGTLSDTCAKELAP